MKCKTAAAALLCAVLLAGCAGEKAPPEEFTLEAPGSTDAGETVITLSGTEADIQGGGAALSDGILKITEGGRYILFGSFTGGVELELEEDKCAELVLAGVKISSEDGAALYVKSAESVTLTLRSETENTLSDGSDYALPEDAEPSACVYSKDDLIIEGEGSLNVYGKSRNGIQSKDSLIIRGGDITVTAAKNAVKGKDSVEISGGKITVPACKDGIKSDGSAQKGKGGILISAGEVSLTCQDDGLQAEREIRVTGGRLNISAADKVFSCPGVIDVAEGCVVE